MFGSQGSRLSESLIRAAERAAHVARPASDDGGSRVRAVHRARAVLRRSPRDPEDDEDANLARQFLRALCLPEVE